MYKFNVDIMEEVNKAFKDAENEYIEEQLELQARIKGSEGDKDNGYSIKQDESQLFSLSGDGIDEPMWSIDVEFNGNESNATVLINEVEGTIEIANKGNRLYANKTLLDK